MSIQARPRRGAKPPRIVAAPLARLVPLLALTFALVVHLAQPAAAADLSRAVAATLVVYSDDRDEAFLGSAFLWQDGTVAVTAAHVVGGAASVELRAEDGTRLSARVLARDAGRDIALLAVPGAPFGPGLEPAPALPGVGEPVFAIGAPLGAEFTATEGMISATGRAVEPATPVRYLQHDAAVNPGSSGGPLVDAEGRLVGMNSLIADGSRLFAGIAYAMSAADIARLVPELAGGSLPPVPELGLRLRPVSRTIAEALAVAAGTGLLVDHIVADGLADRSGLEPGDMLLTFDGHDLSDPADLAVALEARAGDHPRLILKRGGLTLEIVLDLTPPPPVLQTLAAPAMPVRIARYGLAELGIATDGTTVTALAAGSPGEFAGLAAGDTILSVNGVAVLDPAGIVAEGPLLFLVRRGGQTLHVIVDPWSSGRGPRPVGGANVLDPAVVLF